MELTPKQKRKLDKIAKVIAGGELAIAEHLLEIEDEFENTIERLKQEMPNLDKVLESIRGDDGEDYVLTDDDVEDIAEKTASRVDTNTIAESAAKLVATEQFAENIAQRAASKIKVPIVEKVIEKTEVTREVPNEIDVDGIVDEKVDEKVKEQEERIKKAIKEYTDELFDVFKEDSTTSQGNYTDEIKTLQNRTQLLLQIATQRTNTTSGGSSTPTDGWALTGNSGTTAGTNFVGTTDNTDLVFKRSGSEFFRLTSAGFKFTNTSFLDASDEEWLSYSSGSSMIVGNPADLSAIVLTPNYVDLSPKTDGTGGVAIRNAKPLRFFEGVTDMSNYIGLKPPSSLSADVEFTLPATDAVRSGGGVTSNQSGVLSFDYFLRSMGSNTADSSAVANTTSETLFDVVHTVPTADINEIGRTYLIFASGRMSSTGTPTLTFRLKGGVSSADTLWDSGALVSGAGITDRPWQFLWIVTTRATGATGQLHSAPVQARADARFSSTAKNNATLDLTFPCEFGVSLQWSAASASNTATLDTFLVIDVNKR